MFSAGADVVYHAAGGSGIGVFEAANAAGGLAIGVDADQYLTAPADTKKSILTSMLKRVDAGARWYLRALAQKSSIPRVVHFNLANDGVDYSRSNPRVQPYVATAESLRQRILDGDIVVPDKL